MKQLLNKFKDPWVIGLFVAALLLGFFLRGSGDHSGLRVEKPGPASMEHAAHQKTTLWTCAMHPQIKLPQPGNCPICGMKLIPVETETHEMSERQIAFSESAVKLADIQTTPVERKFVEKKIRMVGKVDYDETNVSDITAYVGGRLDRLYVDYTGVTVNKGDHMVLLYSPELLSAQEELIQALKTVDQLKKSDVSILKETALATVESAREKLRLWGLTQDQIKAIETRGIPIEHLTIYSPMSGVVINKNAVEGKYVQTGSRIYTIADLSKVWVKLDAYESDLSWLHYGQEVEFVTEAYPGEIFKGKIAFIDPVLNEKTRTVNVRVNVPNKDRKLKPGMFVKATVSANLSSGNKVMDPSLAGHWLCPMHPEVVKEEPGNCPICGMDLVKAETLGYTSATEEGPPLVIPTSAPLITGKRAVVYVKVPGKEMPTFEGREVVLGPKAEDYYIVESGLVEGEEVVTRGNFKIDSALQIQAKPSMMNPEGGAKPMEHHHN